MRSLLLQRLRNRAGLALAALCILACVQSTEAQSSDISYPAPVFSNEIIARIPPRDLGDSRQTRHFYTFKGMEGDLTVTVESSDLNGDVDVFMAKTLRPLLKVTLFGGTVTKATKSVYLRKEETLILRVEARAVGDTDAGYRILLGGAFAPAPADLAQSPDLSNPSPEPTQRSGTRRVTATGARIDKPQPEVAEATPTPTPEPASTEAATTVEKPVTTRTPPRSRRGRNSRGAANRSRTPAPVAVPAETTGETETASSETRKPEEEKSESGANPPAAKAPPKTPRRRGARAASRPTPASESSEAPSSTAATPPPPAVTILRLVIVTKDGETLERDMSTVRRVTVEKNQIVVVLTNGTVVRTPLALVAKMSFEP